MVIKQKCSSCKKVREKYLVVKECSERLCNNCVAVLIYRHIKHWYQLVEKGFNVEFVYMKLECNDIKFKCGFCRSHCITVDMSDKANLLKFMFHKLGENKYDKSSYISMIINILDN